MSSTEPSFRPRLTTTFTFTGSPACGRRVDPAEHARDREVDVVHRPEDLVVQRVEADRDPRQPRVGEHLRLLREERPVGREREVEVAERRQLRDEHLQVAPEQRLATRDAELRHAEVDEHRRDAPDLLEGQELAPGQEAVVLPEDLFRHAVDAAEVAAVGDRDAEIAERPAGGVENGHAGTA